MTNGLDLTKDDWDALEALASEDKLTIENEELLARLEAWGLVAQADGRHEVTPDGRLKLASHHLLQG